MVFTGPWVESFDSFPSVSKNKKIYVSLGTLVDRERKIKILGLIKDVCDELKIETLISWGSEKDFPEEGLFSTPYVQIAPFVNQLEVLSNVSLMINHAGINSVQESIFSLTPMICIPIKHDQPYVARKVQELGLGGCLLPFDNHFSEKLKQMIVTELNNDRTNALKKMRTEIIELGGLKRAVTELERIL